MPKQKQKIYLIGAKGVGMTMLAQFLVSKGNIVSGSDIKDVFLTDRVLKQAKVKVSSPFSPKNIPAAPDLIIYSSAFSPENNPELAFIKANPQLFRGVPQLSYAEALGNLFNRYQGIAVCGSHGKTTTAAWLGYVLARSGKQPKVLVGSRVPQFKGSALLGKSKLFVAEIDEYQDKFKYFSPHGVVLNNIDYDHPDFFRTPAEYTAAFARFIKKIPASGFLVINDRDRESRKVRRHCRGRVISYGAKGSDYFPEDIKASGAKTSFRVWESGRDRGRFEIRLWGEHNVSNALAVIAAARHLGVSWPQIRKHLAGFKGTERRAQTLGKHRGALVIDDYAHHPTEVRATLQGLKEHYPEKRLVVVFHPHTFTRTKALFRDFVSSFALASELMILNIYGSAREEQGGVSSRKLAGEIKKYNCRNKVKQDVRNIATIPLAAKYLDKKLRRGDVLVLMGAGDVFRVYQELKRA